MVEMIPELKHKLGWVQPDRSSITFKFQVAWISKENFDKLKLYEIGDPDGVYPGKMWRREYILKSGKKLLTRNLLCWYQDSKTKGYCDIVTIELVINEKD